MAQETNSFSPVPTTREDFAARSLFYGEEIIAVSKKEDKQLAGFLEAVEAFGKGRVAVVPILKAWSMSGGPVEQNLYDEFKQTIVDGLSSCKQLAGIYLSLHGEIKPVMAFSTMRLLKGGGMAIDFLSPMRNIFKRMKKMVKSSGKVLDVSNFMVHIWLDDPELGWSTVVITDNDPALAQSLADEIADMNWSVRAEMSPKGNTAREAVAIAKSKTLLRKFGTVVFCDVSDALGAGAPGENTWILKSLMEEGPGLTSYLFIGDAVAFHNSLVQAVMVSRRGPPGES